MIYIRNILQLGVLVIFLALLAGCENGEKPRIVMPDLPSNRESCEKNGGEWTEWLSSQRYYCSLPVESSPTSDGGKGCQDSSECEGSCLLISEDIKDYRGYQNWLSSVRGKCSDQRVVYGCHYFVCNGKMFKNCDDVYPLLHER